jgi:Zn-dependent peptidase ImmA (M78 family)
MKEKELYEKLNQREYGILRKKGLKTKVAKELGITRQAFSYQLKQLELGKGINIKTLIAIEKITGINFFIFQIP